jgi:hypothetical protein
MARIPREARDGLMRAWLAILSERHPEMTWVPVTREDDRELEGEVERSSTASPLELVGSS